MNHYIKSALVFLAITLSLVFINSCKKPTDDEAAHETGTMTDIENNVYKTVKIGNQWWMAEDLKVTKYRDGNQIAKISLESQFTTDSILWVNDITGAYCNNLNIAKVVIGKLYNWYAVHNNEKIAPEGWHIPSDEEWKELEKQLGMSQSEADKQGWRGTHEGEKMKIEAPNGWTTYGEVWGNNESGFSAIAVGCRLFNSKLGDPGLFSTAFWWSSSSQDAGNEAWYRYLDYKNKNVFRSHCLKSYGFSIRCVKD